MDEQLNEISPEKKEETTIRDKDRVTTYSPKDTINKLIIFLIIVLISLIIIIYRQNKKF